MRSEDLPIPPTPSTLEALAAAHLAHDRRLLEAMRQLRDAEADLQAALSSALSAGMPAPPAGWQGWLVRLGLLRPPPPPPLLEEDLWRHHEQALSAVRALGHHLEVLEGEQALLAADIASLEAYRLALARARGEESARLSLLRSRGEDAEERGLRRLEAGEERVAGLLDAHREVHETLRDLVGGVEPLYHQGSRAMDALSRRITALAAEAVARKRAGVAEALQQSLGELALAAELQSHHAGQEVDALRQRLRRLDEEAARRARARAEVEGTLRVAPRGGA